jgi:hypothetical protein
METMEMTSKGFHRPRAVAASFGAGLLRLIGLCALIALGALAMPGAALAYGNSVPYSGQGLIADGFGAYDLITERCGVENGADAEGPYLLWVLTAPRANNADITGPWGTAAMTKTGNGIFKYVSEWYDPDTLPGQVSATYDGRGTNAQLVISHGCRPFNEGAWCSPGFWRNARDGAWALIGVDRTTALFNGNVSTAFYGANLSPDALLQFVLNNPPTYSGPPFAGTDPRTIADPLNAFNATGAYLTDLLPGFSYDPDVKSAGGSDACPIDSFGNLK